MTNLRTILCAAVVAANLCSLGGAQAIQLRTGEILVGEVVDATSEGLSFRRLDTGGFLELGWDDLSNLHATRIKRLKGLVVEEDEEPTIEADVLTISPGGAVREEVVGLIDWDASNATHLKLKRKNDVLPVFRSSIKKQSRRDVPVLEVYTADEWYELRKADIAPGEDADKHIALAEEMRRTGLYDRALTHLLEAERLGGGKQSAQLPTFLQRVRALKESAAERDMLAKIRVLRNRKEFDQAEKLMAEFEQTYPKSKLLGELTRERGHFEEALADFAVERLRQGWDSVVRRIAEEFVAEKSTTLAQARAYGEEKMADDVFARLGKTLEMEPDELRKYWQEREQHGHGRAVIHSYGIGSWVLDEDKLIAGTAAAKGGNDAKRAATDTAEDRELERVIRKLREYRDQRRRAAGGEEADDNEESWWRDASRAERIAWLRAYFAEFGGQMEVTAAYAAPCGACDGAGFSLEVGDTGKEKKVKCSVCHGKKYTRTIRAR